MYVDYTCEQISNLDAEQLWKRCAKDMVLVKLATSAAQSECSSI